MSGQGGGCGECAQIHWYTMNKQSEHRAPYEQRVWAPCQALPQGTHRDVPRGARGGDLQERTVQARQGRAVQVDSFKPVLKAPTVQRMKLYFDKLLSTVAFKSNLRRYCKVGTDERFLDTGLARVLEAAELVDPAGGALNYLTA